MAKIEWYHEFINKKYKPKNNDLKVLFYFETDRGISKDDAIGRIASESSSGTWTTLANRPKLLPKVKAYAYDLKGNYVKVAYPRIILEDSSVPGMISGIGGNIFGMKAVKNLRLMDAELPEDYIKTFRGPYYGKNLIKKIFKRQLRCMKR